MQTVQQTGDVHEEGRATWTWEACCIQLNGQNV